MNTFLGMAHWHLLPEELCLVKVSGVEFH